MRRRREGAAHDALDSDAPIGRPHRLDGANQFGSAESRALPA